MIRKVRTGTGATLELLLAQAKALRPFTDDRTFAIAQIRRFLACGRSLKARSNLAVPRKLSDADLQHISSKAFDA